MTAGKVTLASLTPSTYSVLLDVIERNALGLTVAELDGLRRACQKQIKLARYTGLIMAEASVSEGDRVQINDNYGYKSLHGITGTVKEVHSFHAGRNPWCYMRITPDALPKRVPRYAVDADGLVAVAGHCVDLIAST